MKSILKILFILSLPISLFAQKSLEEVLMLKAKVSSTETTIEWPEDASMTSYTIYRRDKGAKDWQKLGTATGADKGYTDKDVKPHEAFEYQVVKETGAARPPIGYLYSGFEVPEIASHGGIILLIDSTFITSLSKELVRLEQDLVGEGWAVSSIYAGRDESVTDVKQRIIDENEEMKVKATALLIIGHVPVPYSGFYLYNQPGFFPPPDGHDDHVGAWPADVYYGDLDGEWKDEQAYVENEKRPKNENVIGDGKFDHSKLPSDVELEVGRVDFFDMPAFSQTEEGLMKAYLDRNHSWRVGEWQVRQRALVDDNFKGFNLAATGHHNFTTMLNVDSVFDDLDYIVAQSEGSFLWSYGCGAGSFTSCNGLNNGARAHTSDIAAQKLENVYTITAGSYFGDWNVTDNFLRAPLCNTALTNFWGGIPKWYVHHMAMGETIGYGTRISQNNFDHFDNGVFNGSWQGVHMALMGDPTLTMKYLPVPSNLQATGKDGDVELTWNGAIGEFDGYNVYRLNEKGKYEKVNDDIITTTRFIDINNWQSGKYLYSVRCVKLETTPSGSYFNVGGGPTAEIDHVNGIERPLLANFNLYPNPANNLVKVEYAGLQDGPFQIEVRSLTGQLVLNRTEKSDGSNAVVLDVSNVNRGVYLVSITQSGRMLAKKRLIKMI